MTFLSKFYLILSKYTFLTICLLGLSNVVVADVQSQKYIDSLKRIVVTSSDKAEMFKALFNVTYSYLNSGNKEAVEYLNKSNAIAHELGDSCTLACVSYLNAFYFDEVGKKDTALTIYTEIVNTLKHCDKSQFVARCYSFSGNICMTRGEYEKALSLYAQSQLLNQQLNDNTLILNNLTYTGLCYSQMANFPEAINYLLKALRAAKKLNAKEREALILMYIGAAYNEGTNKEYAMDYYKQSVALAKELKDTTLLIDAEIYLGNGYFYQKEYAKAIEVYEYVCALSENSSEKIVAYAGAIGNLANTFTEIGKIDKSQEYQFKAIELFKKINDPQGLIECYMGVGKNYYLLKQYQQAIQYLNMALDLAKKMQALETEKDAYYQLALVYEAQHNLEKSYANYKLFHVLNDSIYNTSNTKKLTELELNHRFEMKEKENELIQLHKEQIADEKLENQKLVSYISIGGIVVLFVLIIVVFKNNIERKKTNKELSLLNKEIILKNAVIQEKNNEITGSINYAKRIQRSFLTSEAFIKRKLPDYFILFEPRDIVSGDFYWVDEKNNQIFVCTADCTGHGIPGAFMSLIGMSILNEIINSKINIKHTDDILNELRRIIIMALNPEGAIEEGKDGMDAVLCKYDLQKMELEYSAANNPFYIVRKGILLEFKPDKMPVGKYVFDDKPFARHTVSLEKGDCIYTFSDGYADQFGGENGKKFKYAQFKELLLSIHNQPMSTQKKLLKEHFNSWKGNTEQIDDVCVIGIRV